MAKQAVPFSKYITMIITDGSLGEPRKNKLLKQFVRQPSKKPRPDGIDVIFYKKNADRLLVRTSVL